MRLFGKPIQHGTELRLHCCKELEQTALVTVPAIKALYYMLLARVLSAVHVHRVLHVVDQLRST